jgi:hypothetical protein
VSVQFKYRGERREERREGRREEGAEKESDNFYFMIHFHFYKTKTNFSAEAFLSFKNTNPS